MLPSLLAELKSPYQNVLISPKMESVGLYKDKEPLLKIKKQKSQKSDLILFTWNQNFRLFTFI